ncbi:RteC domain-containing protein [Parapedobacter sp. DT-150]|uniref:RteC domain-containing protein n=1 Tax=Parapedobacter sp. DT-150 TaxID=3396162 RepID=UPI003F194C27
MDVMHYGNPGAELAEKLESELDGITDPLQRLKLALRTIRRVKAELREKVDARPPATAGEEIHLYKEVWPAVVSWHIQHVEGYAMESNQPIGNDGKLREYWERELAFISRFFAMQPFHYQYYRLGATELDHLYFTVGAEVPDVLIPEVPDVDGRTGTRMGYLFAKFMAYERLQAQLLELLRAPDTGPAGVATRAGREMKWTGETGNLIELAYGIYETRQINDGGVDIGDIIAWLEGSFRVSLHRYYRRFSEIKRRKTISKTRFLDEMRDAVTRRIDEGDAYRPRETPRGTY